MKVLIEHGMPNDGTSALFRSVNPDDWMWADINARLLAELATMASDMRFIAAASRMEEVPKDWRPTTYGPALQPVDDEDAPAESEKVDNARAIAEQIRAEMAGA